MLDIGYKTEGVIPSRELSIKHDVDPHDVVKTGEQIEALVLQKEDKEGRLILSKKRAQYERAWGTIERIKEEDGVVTGTVIEVVKGGLILDIGLRGFLPASLVEMRRVRDLQPYVGKEIEAKIIELDKNRNNVVLSRRAWLEQTQSEVRHTFLNTLRKGQIRKGVVSSIVNFGAFVDLGGVDGLVHVSELSWKHIDHPGEVVEVGQEVTVEVLDVDMDRERVSLSLKSTQEDPWQQFARTHQIGQVVPGRVTKLVPFGAFVRVEEGIEGLVHISELADRHVEIPEQVVQVGEEIFVKIIDIDLDRRRISLSLKQANEGTVGESTGDEFDPTLYGMPATYDEAGNYLYQSTALQSITMIRSPPSTCAVPLSASRVTVPATGVVIEASIFIASILATVSPAATLVADRHHRGDAAAERRGDVPGPGRVGLLGGGRVGLDRAVADRDRAELAVDRAHDGADAALVGLADRLQAEQQRLALLEGDVVLPSGPEPVEVLGGADDRHVAVGRARLLELPGRSGEQQPVEGPAAIGPQARPPARR